MATTLIGVVLVPISAAGTLAIGNTVGSGSATLKFLAISTVAVVLLVTLSAGFGWAGAWLGVTLAAHAYELAVLLACVYRRSEWWPEIPAARIGR